MSIAPHMHKLDFEHALFEPLPLTSDFHAQCYPCSNGCPQNDHTIVPSFTEYIIACSLVCSDLIFNTVLVLKIGSTGPSLVSSLMLSWRGICRSFVNCFGSCAPWWWSQWPSKYVIIFIRNSTRNRTPCLIVIGERDSVCIR